MFEKSYPYKLDIKLIVTRCLLRDIDSFHPEKMENIHKLIGENVKRVRKAKNISQLKLSLAIGHTSVSVISCAEICHNNIHFNIEHLMKIAYVLEVNICEFFEGVDLL